MEITQEFCLQSQLAFEQQACLRLNRQGEFLPCATSTKELDSTRLSAFSLDLASQDFAVSNKAAYELVLKQVETKAKQQVFLEDLTWPQRQHSLQVKENFQGAYLLYIPCLSYDEALSLELKVPETSQISLIIATEQQPGANSERGKKPALYLDFHIADQATCEVIILGGSILSAGPQAVAQNILYQAHLGIEAKFRFTSVHLQGSVLEKGRIYQEGPNSMVDLASAAYVPRGQEHFLQNHVLCQKPQSSAKALYRGVVEAEAKGHLVSISEIAKGVAGTAAHQDNKFLCLDHSAQAFIDPSLLIGEHDVEASHAATVGQLDERASFYLQSRGLSPTQAQKILTAAFLQPIWDRFAHLPFLKEALERWTAEQLALGLEV